MGFHVVPFAFKSFPPFFNNVSVSYLLTRQSWWKSRFYLQQFHLHFPSITLQTHESVIYLDVWRTVAYLNIIWRFRCSGQVVYIRYIYRKLQIFGSPQSDTLFIMAHLVANPAQLLLFLYHAHTHTLSLSISHSFCFAHTLRLFFLLPFLLVSCPFPVQASLPSFSFTLPFCQTHFGIAPQWKRSFCVYSLSLAHFLCRSLFLSLFFCAAGRGSSHFHRKLSQKIYIIKPLVIFVPWTRFMRIFLQIG